MKKKMSERKKIIYPYLWSSVVVGVGWALFFGLLGMWNAFVAPFHNSTTLAIIDFFLFFFFIYVVIWVDAEYHRAMGMLQEEVSEKRKVEVSAHFLKR